MTRVSGVFSFQLPTLPGSIASSRRSFDLPYRRSVCRPSRPKPSRCDQAARQDVTDIALGDEIAHVADRRRNTGLEANNRLNPARPGQRRHLLGFGQAVAQRSLAIDVLAGRHCRRNQFEVRWNLDGHDHYIHVRGGDERLVSNKGMRNAVVGSGGSGALPTGGITALIS